MTEVKREREGMGSGKVCEPGFSLSSGHKAKVEVIQIIVNSN